MNRTELQPDPPDFPGHCQPLVERCAFSKRRRHSSQTVLSSAESVMLGQVPQSFGCRGELHGQKVVKIPFGLSWNQDSLGSVK